MSGDMETSMRQLLAAFLIATAACSSPAPGGGAYSSSSPALKPETVASCNDVNLKVDLAADGMISVNGARSSLEGVKAAAAKKDAACQNAAAMVIYSYTAGSPAETRDEIMLLLKQTIVNLTLSEVSQG